MEEKEIIEIEELMIGFLETSNAQKGTIVNDAFAAR